MTGGDERLHVQNAFAITVPGGWTHEEDEEGGVLLAGPAAAGLLHLLAFEQGEEDLDPAEELYVFLDEQGVELEEDEVEDVELEGGSDLAYCEYLTEDDEATGAGDADDEASTYWLVAVATGPGRLVFCSYSCPAGAQDVERDAVLGALRTLRLNPAAGPGG